MSAALLERRMPQTALHLGADPRHKTIADFLAAIERRRNLAQDTLGSILYAETREDGMAAFAKSWRRE